MEVSSTTDMSGLSQNLLDEKNQEIDHLSEQILRLQSDFSDLKSEKGVENLVSFMLCIETVFYRILTYFAAFSVCE